MRVEAPALFAAGAPMSPTAPFCRGCQPDDMSRLRVAFKVRLATDRCTAGAIAHGRFSFGLIHGLGAGWLVRWSATEGCTGNAAAE
eukprot:1669687-Amphidinium_carterae.1